MDLNSPQINSPEKGRRSLDLVDRDAIRALIENVNPPHLPRGGTPKLSKGQRRRANKRARTPAAIPAAPKPVKAPKPKPKRQRRPRATTKNKLVAGALLGEVQRLQGALDAAADVGPEALEPGVEHLVEFDLGSPHLVVQQLREASRSPQPFIRPPVLVGGEGEGDVPEPPPDPVPAVGWRDLVLTQAVSMAMVPTDPFVVDAVQDEELCDRVSTAMKREIVPLLDFAVTGIVHGDHQRSLVEPLEVMVVYDDHPMKEGVVPSFLPRLLSLVRVLAGGLGGVITVCMFRRLEALARWSSLLRAGLHVTLMGVAYMAVNLFVRLLAFWVVRRSLLFIKHTARLQNFPRPERDERPDASSLAAVKHVDPLICRVTTSVVGIRRHVHFGRLAMYVRGLVNMWLFDAPPVRPPCACVPVGLVCDCTLFDYTRETRVSVHPGEQLISLEMAQQALAPAQINLMRTLPEIEVAITANVSRLQTVNYNRSYLMTSALTNSTARYATAVAANRLRQLRSQYDGGMARPVSFS